MCKENIYIFALTERSVSLKNMMDKKAIIIETATELFSERGYENTSIAAITEKAEVSKGLVAHHFKSKDGLLREIYSQSTALIKKMNTEKSEQLEPAERLIHVLESFFDQLVVNKLAFQFDLNVMTQPTTRGLLADLIEKRSEIILQETQTIFKGLNVEDEESMSYLFIAELDGIAMSYLCSRNSYPLAKVKEYIIKKYQEVVKNSKNDKT